MERKVIAVDIDGVLCEDDGDYSHAGLYNRKPIKETIDKVNRLYGQKHIIIIYTSRNPDRQQITEAWLRDNGVRFTAIRMGKLWFDHYIEESEKLIPVENWNGLVTPPVHLRRVIQVSEILKWLDERIEKYNVPSHYSKQEQNVAQLIQKELHKVKEKIVAIEGRGSDE